MTVIDRTTRETSISEEAFDLITCFYDGVDEVVREVAEEIAVKRGSFLPDDPQTVAIEIQDVQEAGKLVVDAIKKAIAENHIQIDVEAAMEMGDCFNMKS